MIDTRVLVELEVRQVFLAHINHGGRRGAHAQTALRTKMRMSEWFGNGEDGCDFDRSRSQRRKDGEVQTVAGVQAEEGSGCAGNVS